MHRCAPSTSGLGKHNGDDGDSNSDVQALSVPGEGKKWNVGGRSGSGVGRN